MWSESLDYWLHCLDADTGKEIWRYRTWGYCGLAQPVITNNVIVFGSNSLHFLDTETGERKKKIKLSFFQDRDNNINSVIIVGKKIYFDIYNNQLYTIKEK